MSDSSSGRFRARRRLFVGGLYKGVTKDDLRMKFKPFGDVSNIQIIERFVQCFKNYLNIIRFESVYTFSSKLDCHYKTFAYLDVLMLEKNFQKCLSTFNECSWRGETMRVAMAKEYYLDRLRREKEGFQNQDLVTPTITMTSTVEDMKSAIPGTQIKNKPNWIIGKYGRALPVMFLRRKDGKKLGKFDPSKTSHCLKKISENEQSKLVDELTWNLLDETAFYNSEILAKKRPHPYPEDEKNHSKCLQFNSDVYINRKSAIKCDMLGNANDDEKENYGINHALDGGFESENCEDLSTEKCASNNNSHTSNISSHDNERFLHGENDISKLVEKSINKPLNISPSCTKTDSMENNMSRKLNDEKLASLTKHGKKKVSDESKYFIIKRQSNKARLETLEARKEVLKSQQDIVTNALLKVDSGSVEAKNHIIFDNEESTDHVDINFVKAHHGQKVVGSKALSWLGMEISGNDEENNSEENNLEDIFQKKHFEGRSGEKLMAMQQRFGHDMRFKMDERFLDSDDESKSENDIRMGDDIDEELKQEKQLSWKVLHEVLGQNFMTIEDEKDIRNVYRDSIDVHYDPSRQNHSKFEEEVKKRKIEMRLHLRRRMSDDAELFSFFSQSKQLKDVNCENKEGMKIDEWKGPVNLSLPYDSSESESDDDSACSSKSFTVKTKTFLFYNPKNRKMLESLQAESSSFVRKESVESLTQYWVKTRKELTQDYKKKRKDALRKRKRFTRKT
ncbi:nucleolar protein 8-like [Xenia sp. Carnegie-2017]|uniref:nucleolar protein 8-like n=1 Tax=Xenia sp. Carnegie-2017 TaxID=2897299 RepID=UPI001F03B727|nr:nucleolar protein 8-like [Xenia sp. Carnegie-2017]